MTSNTRGIHTVVTVLRVPIVLLWVQKQQECAQRVHWENMPRMLLALYVYYVRMDTTTIILEIQGVCNV